MLSGSWSKAITLVFLSTASALSHARLSMATPHSGALSPARLNFNVLTHSGGKSKLSEAASRPSIWRMKVNNTTSLMSSEAFQI